MEMTGKKHQTHTRGRGDPKSGKKKASPQASHPRRRAKAAQAPRKGVVAVKGSPWPNVAIQRVALQRALQELAGKGLKVKLRIDPQGKCAAGVTQTDAGFEIYLNPGRIKTKDKLEGHINWIRGQVV